MTQAVAERGLEAREAFEDLRSFIAACDQLGECQKIDGADWNLEIGALTEVTAELLSEPPLLLFDHIKDYPPGHRVASLHVASTRRAALALGLPFDRPKLELVRLASRKVKAAHGHTLPPVTVSSGPVMDHVFNGPDVDIWSLPVPRYHADDGGRYIGTGSAVINRDPETGVVNVGNYRMQVHEKNLLGIWISPGQHGRQICMRYWERGESCPIAVAFGVDPLTYMASHTKIPWGRSELEFAGGLRGRPVEVIEGPVTGLPIPAHAEIALEGEIPPPEVEARDEGPFGEWPGYYSGGTRGTGEPQPVLRVKALYHRDAPILQNSAPLWPGARTMGLPLDAGLLWDQLESAGIQDVVGVFTHTAYLVVVAIRQRYAGHAKQTGHAAVSCGSRVRHGRYVVVVDEDIDPTNLKEVLWAMQTRVNPTTDIEIIDGCTSTPVEPRIDPERRAIRDFTIPRAIFYAVRPYAWRDKFPQVSRTPRDLRHEIVEKYRGVLPFPPLS
jgi:4-hydroxy-3-polyprenylbenzoate decarboxylase